jgi:CubicO group peptidase (beta-lactamase class C family)
MEGASTVGRIPNQLCATSINEACLFRALERIRRRKAAAQICVLRGGEVVLNEVIHCSANSLFWIFSASKPFMAMLIYLLAEREQVRLDWPVATYWPKFAQHGKSHITIRQVLQHRSGLVQSMSIGDAFAISNWDAILHRVARSRPALMPGDGPAYQALSYGFILGEVVQRVTQCSVQEVLSREFLEPLAMRNTFLGLPDELWERHVPVSGEGRYGRLAAWVVNRRAMRYSVNPSAGISTTAADMAVFYQMLLSGGVVGARHILRTSSIEVARTPSCDGEFDRCAKKPIRWAQGFQLGGPRSDPRFVSPMGAASSPLTFGHNGSNCCIAWADPTRQVAFAYLTNRLTAGKEAVAHLAAVADDILAGCVMD